jgi:magnesium transporter
MLKFLRREFMMALALAFVLGLVSFGRIYYTTTDALSSFIVSFALGAIVLISVTLGSCIPFVLHRLKIDPAFSAGPVLATIMDILGVIIFCHTARVLLS